VTTYVVATLVPASALAEYAGDMADPGWWARQSLGKPVTLADDYVGVVEDTWVEDGDVKARLVIG